ncbi:protein GDAP2 homolog [Mytilus galloprovincialis]|uniref:protein GDAP2 homolog n=1 Tax=Mytilus galloprovincialis TaxID=29158 RepID=UPI003F7B5C39
MEDVDPLGTRPTVVQIEDLTRWNLTALLETRENDNNSEDFHPFPWRNDLNAKIILWCGDVTTLDVHAIVHSTNEKLNDKSIETETLYAKAGQELVDEIRNNVRVCKTGEAKLTKGHKLLARYVLHTVGPRYNVKYITAAESALYSCYRNVMQLVRENSIKSVALYPIHSTKRSYPVKEGAHLAIRTIRRFLEKYGDDIETIIFCCNEESIDAYLKILPLYFPRNETEEKIAVTELPLDIGNEDGEPVIPERQIRIMDKPTLAAMRKSSLEGFEETVDLNKEFATSTIVEVGRHPFAKMEENPDTHKKTHMYGKTTDEQKEKDNKRRYERYLKRAKTEDLTDIAALKCLYRTGTDKFGRPVIVFVGKLFPINAVDLDKAFLYLIRVLEPIAEKDYVVVYFHTQSTAENHPTMNYLKNAYCVLDEKYKKNLKAFYVVHPTWWSKLTTWYFTTFTASDLKNKVYNLKGVQYLYGTISPDQLDVPSFVINYDTEINGFRYYVPPEQEEAAGL